MDDTKPKELGYSSLNLTENIFLATLAYTLEFSVIYLVTTILIFSGLYTYVWPIQAVGLLAIIHLIAVPIAFWGVRNDNRLMVLLSLLLCCIWFILIIVYVVVFSVQEFEGNDFKYRSLHHLVLAIYMMVDVVLVLLLSFDIVSEKSRKSFRQSLNQSPTEPTAPTQPTGPTAPTTSSKSVRQDESLKKK